MWKKRRTLTPDMIEQYTAHLREQERAGATVQKYAHDLTALREFLDGEPLTKEAVLAWKEQLTGDYAPASVNSMLAAANGFFDFMGWQELKMKKLKIQRGAFLPESRELSRQEYERLVQAALQRGNERLALVLQTICATGIRVSELRFITAEAVKAGRAEIANKGKRRVVFLSKDLRKPLEKYLRKQKITAGAVFVTCKGNPLDRSNIWREMKRLCDAAGVEPGKVFPHNLRHLFARAFYAMHKDLSRLADILGHSSVNTTRIYTAESGAEHARRVEKLKLVLTT